MRRRTVCNVNYIGACVDEQVARRLVIFIKNSINITGQQCGKEHNNCDVGYNLLDCDCYSTSRA